MHLHNCTTVQVYNYQVCNCSSVQLFRCTSIQLSNCTTVQLYNCTMTKFQDVAYNCTGKCTSSFFLAGRCCERMQSQLSEPMQSPASKCRQYCRHDYPGFSPLPHKLSYAFGCSAVVQQIARSLPTLQYLHISAFQNVRQYFFLNTALV